MMYQYCIFFALLEVLEMKKDFKKKTFQSGTSHGSWVSLNRAKSSDKTESITI